VMRYGLSKDNEDTPASDVPSRTITYIRIAISLVVLGVVLYIILSQKFPDEFRGGIISMVISKAILNCW
jgi:hypothetical protein